MRPLKIECISGDWCHLLTGKASNGNYFVATTSPQNPVPDVVELDRASMLEISHYWKTLLDQEEVQ